MNQPCYPDDVTNEADTQYMWSTNVGMVPQVPQTGEPWPLAPFVGGSTIHSSGFTSLVGGYLAQCTYPDGWSGYAAPMPGQFARRKVAI